MDAGPQSPMPPEREPPPGGPPEPQSPPPPSGSPEVPPGGWTQPLTETPAQTGPLASYGSRTGAWIVDLLVVLVPAVIVIALVVNALASGDAGVVAWLVSALVSFSILAVFFLVYAPLTMMRRGHNGQTLGKQLLGIRVVKKNGQPVDVGTAALREAGLKILALGIASSFVPLIPFLVDYLWPLFDDDNQAVHDIIAETLVVQA